MNFQSLPVKAPLRVLFINSLTTSAKLIAFKIMTGHVFGRLQLIDMILLVYENEVTEGETFASEIESCAFSSCNSVRVTSNLPSISDADVFVAVTNFENPNFLDFTQLETDRNFDSFYLLLKVANNFSSHPPQDEKTEDKIVPGKRKKRTTSDIESRMKPIFFTDGLVALDIFKSFAKVIPDEALFCPSSIPPIVRTVLGDYLKLSCEEINDVRVWAASDKIVHVEVNRPILRRDKVQLHGPRCSSDMIGPAMMEELNLDHTQFNDSWMKKELIEKVVSIASDNVYGPIYKAHEMSKAIRAVWIPKRDNVTGYYNMGFISGGGMGTIKGLPYVMPLVMCGDSYKVHEGPDDQDNSYIKAIIKIMNNAVYEHHRKLMIYCKKFLQNNVIGLEFVPGDDDSTSYTTPITTTQLTSSSDSMIEF